MNFADLPESLKTDYEEPTTLSAIAEVFRIGVGIAEIVVDENGRLAGQFEALAALVASDQIVQPHHVRTGFRKLAAVFLADAARQLLFLPADLPAHGRLEFTTATRTDQLYLPGFFFFRVKRAFVHDQGAGVFTASPIVTNSRPRSCQRGSQCSRAASVRERSPFSSRCAPS